MLVEEVPAKTEMNGHRVNGIVRHKEGMAGTCVNVPCRNIYAAMLQVHVSISSDDGITAYLHPLIIGVLHSKLLNSRAVVGSVVRGKETHVCS